MSSILRFKEQMKEIHPVSVHTSTSEVMAALRAFSRIFVVLDGRQRPQTLLGVESLPVLANAGNRPLGSVLNRLPALISVDYEVEALNADDLRMFYRLLQESHAPGVAVLRDEAVSGVIVREDIISSMRLVKPSAFAGKPRFGGGSSMLQTCSYVCRKCQPPPPRRRPRLCDTPPLCPRSIEHGEMTPERI